MKLECLKGLVRKYKENPSEMTLFKEELDVVLAVMFHVLGQRVPKKGTFILAGQRHGEKMQTIVEFNFKEGKQRNFIGQDRDSDVMAANNLWDASTYASNPGAKAITHMFNSPQIMSLETTHGRFLAAFFADGGEFSKQETIYRAITKAIAMLGRDDVVLQKSCDATFDSDSKTENYVKFLFETRELPEIKTWSAWHDQAKSRIFFD